MSALGRVRGTCRACHTTGRFTPVQLMFHEDGSWLWSLQLLCAVCRSAVADWFKPTQRKRELFATSLKERRGQLQELHGRSAPCRG